MKNFLNAALDLLPTAETFERIGRRTLDDLPELFARHVKDVPIVVQDFADEEVLGDMEIDDPYDLLGLYHGIPVGHRETIGVPSGDMDLIFLYRRPILAYARDEGLSLEDTVRHVLIHEIGHHFGLSDDDMEQIEREAEDEK